MSELNKLARQMTPDYGNGNEGEKGMSEEINCTNEEFITCPYCGYVNKGSWEVSFGGDCEGNTEVTCGVCEENFLVFRHVEVSYGSYKIDEQKQSKKDG